MIIGLTGGIASGKSTVSSFLRELGAPIIDADELAHELSEPKQPLWQAFTEHFGQSILAADGHIDRQKLGALVFTDSSVRAKLDSLAHPLIKAALQNRLTELTRQGAAVVVLDVPLLFEVGWDKMADEVWVVYVDAAEQKRRLMERNTLTADAAQARIDSQWPLAEKRRRASFVIDNTRDLAYTKEQVRQKWQMVRKMVDDKNNGCG